MEWPGACWGGRARAGTHGVRERTCVGVGGACRLEERGSVLPTTQENRPGGNQTGNQVRNREQPQLGASAVGEESATESARAQPFKGTPRRCLDSHSLPRPHGCLPQTTEGDWRGEAGVEPEPGPRSGGSAGAAAGSSGAPSDTPRPSPGRLPFL